MFELNELMASESRSPEVDRDIGLPFVGADRDKRSNEKLGKLDTVFACDAPIVALPTAHGFEVEGISLIILGKKEGQYVSLGAETRRLTTKNLLYA